jgi:NAD(P)H dehydrogenase (quinone)
MHVLIVQAHMEPTSFTAALTAAAVAEIAARGHTSEVSDLYAQNFNPVAGRHDTTSVADPARFHYQTEQLHAAANGTFAPDLAREQDRVRRADLIVFAFPLWWGGPPAILKGWIDRVLACGFAYVDGARFDTGHFKGKRGILCVTTGGTPARFTEDGVYGPIDKVLWPLQRLVLAYMGLDVAAPFVAYAAPRVTPAERAAYLAEWRARLGDLLAVRVGRS